MKMTSFTKSLITDKTVLCMKEKRRGEYVGSLIHSRRVYLECDAKARNNNDDDDYDGDDEQVY